jgi:hypothetical protein
MRSIQWTIFLFGSLRLRTLLPVSISISSLICISLILPGFLGLSLGIHISQLQAILSKWPAAMIREDEACHDEATRVAFCEQSVKIFFTYSRPFQSVQFVEPSPIGLVPQIHALVFDCGFDSRVVEICDAIKNGSSWTTAHFHPPA